MKNLFIRLILIVAVFVCVYAQVPQSDSLSKYQSQSCCPQGYNMASGIYCVKCNASKHWDAISQRCVSCDAGHTWDNVTHECSCCQLPRTIVGGNCVCPAPKTQWDNAAMTCSCPANTFGDNCVPCPAPRQWNYQSNKCFCPAPTT